MPHGGTGNTSARSRILLFLQQFPLHLSQIVSGHMPTKWFAKVVKWKFQYFSLLSFQSSVQSYWGGGGISTWNSTRAVHLLFSLTAVDFLPSWMSQMVSWSSQVLATWIVSGSADPDTTDWRTKFCFFCCSHAAKAHTTARILDQKELRQPSCSFSVRNSPLQDHSSRWWSSQLDSVSRDLEWTAHLELVKSNLTSNQTQPKTPVQTNILYMYTCRKFVLARSLRKHHFLNYDSHGWSDGLSVLASILNSLKRKVGSPALANRAKYLQMIKRSQNRSRICAAQRNRVATFLFLMNMWFVILCSACYQRVTDLLYSFHSQHSFHLASCRHFFAIFIWKQDISNVTKLMERNVFLSLGCDLSFHCEIRPNGV